MADKPKVFHSHAWGDKAIVLPIKAEVDAAGIPGWIVSLLCPLVTHACAWLPR